MQERDESSSATEISVPLVTKPSSTLVAKPVSTPEKEPAYLRGKRIALQKFGPSGSR